MAAVSRRMQRVVENSNSDPDPNPNPNPSPSPNSNQVVENTNRLLGTKRSL